MLPHRPRRMPIKALSGGLSWVSCVGYPLDAIGLSLAETNKFIVANLSPTGGSVPHLYNGRSTTEQRIKEGMYALNWTGVFMAETVSHAGARED